VRLEPLYRARFVYVNEWGVELGSEDAPDAQYLFFAEGRCEGRISGSYRGANHPRRRSDRTYVPDFHGVIESEDGATILFESHGYGRTHPPGRRQVVASVTHLSADERYRRLNDVVCVAVGEVRVDETKPGGVEIVLDVAELVWEPIPD